MSIVFYVIIYHIKYIENKEVFMNKWHQHKYVLTVIGLSIPLCICAQKKYEEGLCLCRGG